MAMLNPDITSRELVTDVVALFQPALSRSECHTGRSTFRRILGNVWGPAYQECVELVYVYISRLRRKLEEDAKDPKYLLTERGLGYRFQK